MYGVLFNFRIVLVTRATVTGPCASEWRLQSCLPSSFPLVRFFMMAYSKSLICQRGVHDAASTAVVVFKSNDSESVKTNAGDAPVLASKYKSRYLLKKLKSNRQLINEREGEG